MKTAIPPHLFMTQARLQATLNSISPPFEQICPVSLLSGKPCHIDGCKLLQLCPSFNDLSLGKAEGDEFPALGVSNITNIPLTENVSNKCFSSTQAAHNKQDDGHVFCLDGHICIQPSCKDEVDGKVCLWRTSKAGLISSGRKFQALDWKHNYSAAPQTSSVSWNVVKPLHIKTTGNAVSHPLSASSSPINNAAPPYLSKSNGIVPTGSGERNSTQESHGNQSTKHLQPLDEKELHLKSYVHERDGIRKDEWHARFTNASLRAMHEGGLWGVAEVYTESVNEIINASTTLHQSSSHGSASSSSDATPEGQGVCTDDAFLASTFNGTSAESR
jgi:hypothetical protein